MKKVNKTNVIKILNENELSKSYSWETSRNTFPSIWWVDIFYDFIKLKVSKTHLEKKYKRYLQKSNINKSDKNMHINVLFKKLLFSEKQDFKKLNKYSYHDLKNMIINHIKSVIKKMKKHNITKNWIKQIEDWEKNINETLIDEEQNTLNWDKEEIKKIINKSIKYGKIEEINYKFHDIYEKNEKIWKNDFLTSENKKKIGKIGENIVYTNLLKEYGLDKVTWQSSVDEYSPYDIEYNDGNKKIYVEVKSSTRFNTMNWYISRREYEFYKSHKNNYVIIFVKGINILNKKGAFLEKASWPKIFIDNNKMGIKNGNFIITPINFKGLI